MRLCQQDLWTTDAVFQTCPQTIRMAHWLSLVVLTYGVAASRTVPFSLDRNRRDFLSPDGQCSLELWELGRQLKQSVEPVSLTGRWVSSQCEVIPGPTFLLRDYRFYDSGSFVFRQYRFEDAECSRPSVGFVAHGHLGHLSRSWAVPGAVETSWTLHRVSTIPYTKAAAKHLTKSLRHWCHMEGDKQFPWPWIDVFRQMQVFKRLPENARDDSYSDEIDCLRAVNFTLTGHELLRMEEVQLQNSTFFFKQLFFGLPILDNFSGIAQLPSQFHFPLRRANEIVRCKVCEKVKNSNQLIPPSLRRLKAKSFGDIMVSLDGDWISTECESHRNGIFAHRQMSFRVQRRRWSLRQRFYDDPFCRRPRYSMEASGEFAPGLSSPVFPNARSVIYTVTNIRVTPETRLSAANLRHARNCGPAKAWSQGVVLDLTNFGGCEALGLQVPHFTTDILRVSGVGPDKQLLYTGNHAGSQSATEIPTSFHPPLQKCQKISVVVTLFSEGFVDSGLETDYFWNPRSGSIRSCEMRNFFQLLCLFITLLY